MDDDNPIYWIILDSIRTPYNQLFWGLTIRVILEWLVSATAHNIDNTR